MEYPMSVSRGHEEMNQITALYFVMGTLLVVGVWW